MEEIWKDIPWYEWYYQVSSSWNVRSINYNRMWILKNLSSYRSKVWYVYVLLAKNKIHKNCKVHRLVLLAFKWKSNLPINHLDWVKWNNNLENIEYCTQQENIQHSINILWNIKWQFWTWVHQKSYMIWHTWEKSHLKKNAYRTNILNWLEEMFHWTHEAARILLISQTQISRLCRSKLQYKWYKYSY